MYHSALDQEEPISPVQFEEIKKDQKKQQRNFIRNAIKRINLCLVEMAGGETPTPFYGRHRGSGGDYMKQYKEYCEFLEGEYAQKELDLVPGLIHLELCHCDCVDPPALYKELRDRLIASGWGQSTRVHKRAGPENMVWVSLDEI